MCHISRSQKEQGICSPCRHGGTLLVDVQPCGCFIIEILTQILHRVVGLGVLYCVISKSKFYSKNNYQKILHFKSVLLFSSIFNQSVPPAAELDSTAPIYFSYSRTTSLCESHREFHYSIVTASV